MLIFQSDFSPRLIPDDINYKYFAGKPVALTATVICYQKNPKSNVFSTFWLLKEKLAMRISHLATKYFGFFTMKEFYGHFLATTFFHLVTEKNSVASSRIPKNVNFGPCYIHSSLDTCSEKLPRSLSSVNQFSQVLFSFPLRNYIIVRYMYID